LHPGDDQPELASFASSGVVEASVRWVLQSRHTSS
jgi:hypothetical protein